MSRIPDIPEDEYIPQVLYKAINDWEAKSPMYNQLEVFEKRGKWIEHEDCTGTFNKCSNCGAGGLVNEFPYCPWCGCQMDLD